MILAVAALLLLPAAVPQNVAAIGSQSNVGSPSATVTPVPPELSAENALPTSDADSSAPLLALPLVASTDVDVPEFDTSSFLVAPAPAAPEDPATPGAPVAVTVIAVTPGAPDPAEPADPSFRAVTPNSSAEDRAADYRRKSYWLTLGVVQQFAATFDAFSTRRAISNGGQELNPLLRPFAGNDSLYLAIQAGPLVLDYVSHRLMTSNHPWLRHTWWVPQAAGTAMSLASGIHNLDLPAAQ